MLLGFLLYKYKQVNCVDKVVSQTCFVERKKNAKIFLKLFLAFRSRDTKFAGRLLRPEMETTTRLLTPLSYRTMTSGNFQETN